MIPGVGSVDLRLLHVFRSVVECGGFSAAQVELNVGQSTISTQMAVLEERLGVRLCRRGRAGFSLTDDGRSVYEACLRLFRSLDSFGSEVGALRGRLVGDLHVGVLDNMISNPDCRLDQAFARFKARGGAVHLTLHVASPLDIERAVLDGRFHVGVGTFPNRSPGLAHEPLFRERMNLYCGRRHALFARPDEDIEPVEAEGEEYVRRGYATVALTGGFAPRKVTATAFNMEAVALLLLSGRYIGHLPDHYARKWVARGEMRPIRPDSLGFESVFEVIVRKGIPHNAAIAVFLDALAEGAGDRARPAVDLSPSPALVSA
jgi:DNA-binding transcriptional LysR family regulator